MKFEDWLNTKGINRLHRHRILDDDVIGCYSCCDTFLGCEIEVWIDDQRFGGLGETALCPHCGIDAVVRIEDILRELSDRRFGRD